MQTNKPIQTRSKIFTQLHPAIQKILKKRQGDDTHIQEFLSWDLKQLPPITEMLDLDKAARRIVQAMEKQERIAIYGDYDVDGTTSCALLHHFFRLMNVPVLCFQPSRFSEGYGVHPVSIDTAVENNVKVLITVDCGISNYQTAVYAHDKPLDLIITDHHKDALPELPPAYAIVNPNRRDEPQDSPLGALAGVGVAFALALQIKQILEQEKAQEVPTLYPLLQFVAVGTICDMAPLTPMNLKLSRHGLKQLPRTQFLGLRSFLTPEEREWDFLPSDKVSFQIGPRINSKGRLDHPEKALELLKTLDPEQAWENYQILDLSNNQRKSIQSEVFNEAKKIVLQEFEETLPSACIVYQPHWHEGVIGIVASKLVESFGVPAIVLTDAEDEGIMKGSARTAGELNIFEALNEHRDFFVKFGGHKAAAGLSIEKSQFPEFKRSLLKDLSSLPAILRQQELNHDVEIASEEINPKLVRELELLEPFGQGNPRPIFKITGLVMESYRILKDVHVRWHFKNAETDQRLTGISFNYLGELGKAHPDEIYKQQRQSELIVYGSVAINRFKGREYLQILAEKVEVGL